MQSLRSRIRTRGYGATVALLLGLCGCSDDDVTLNDRDADADTGGMEVEQTGGQPGSGGSSSGGNAMGGGGATSGGETASGGTPAGTGGVVLPADCPEPQPFVLPDDLKCTGLFTDIEEKQVGPDVREFAPAVALWSDGAEKQRWIYLPPGTKIDSSDPDSWIFPNGTKLFKEFKWKGHRVETRLFQKMENGVWLKNSYHWNADESAATAFAGGMVDVAGDDYYIPTAKECDQCHKGRADRALGFEQILLSLAGAEGLDVKQLLAEDLLTDAPSIENPEVGDDGTGKASAALKYLHVNCGVCCHNDNPASEGYQSNLRLRLPANGVDGRAPAGFASLTSTLGVEAKTARWTDQVRITPGQPDQSLLLHLMETRDPNDPKERMPPIASSLVDPNGTALVRAWIAAMDSN